MLPQTLDKVLVACFCGVLFLFCEELRRTVAKVFDSGANIPGSIPGRAKKMSMH